ncbi:hypothetical protein C2E23DRAFT_386399 [Lenzites betulinus]|nr:hypothetical protein C2E23DRAFT_386399 [Lenzites betulinus]
MGGTDAQVYAGLAFFTNITLRIQLDECAGIDDRDRHSRCFGQAGAMWTVVGRALRRAAWNVFTPSKRCADCTRTSEVDRPWYRVLWPRYRMLWPWYRVLWPWYRVLWCTKDTRCSKGTRCIEETRAESGAGKTCIADTTSTTYIQHATGVEQSSSPLRRARNKPERRPRNDHVRAPRASGRLCTWSFASLLHLLRTRVCACLPWPLPPPSLWALETADVDL